MGGIRWTEDDLKDYQTQQKRKALPCVPPIPSGVSLADMDETKKRSKYSNHKVEIDGMKFDSQKEANLYFGTLLPSWKCGAYKLLTRQVPFDLPGGIRYIADFLTVSMDGHVSVIDVKSEATWKNRVYINKKKQMKACWGIEIQEV